MDCEFIDECRNRENAIKCGKCERNPDNFEKIEKDDNAAGSYKPSAKKFYIFHDNYDPLWFYQGKKKPPAVRWNAARGSTLEVDLL